MTDTDSFVMEVKTEDVYKDIAPDVQKTFHTSNYKEEHPSGLPVGLNKKLPRMMKDKMAGGVIVQYVGLRSKLHGMMSLDGKVKKRAKGVPKSVVKKSVNFDHYRRCLFEGEKVMAQFYTLRSREHVIHTKRVRKIALSSNDDKRYLLQDGSHETLAHGHLDIPPEHVVLKGVKSVIHEFTLVWQG